MANARKILIVDDDAELSHALVEQLALHEEFSAEAVETAAKGVQTATDAIPGGVATDPAIEVVCLIDRGSASASEIVAAALQDSGRATLFGQRSFGKGTVQQWQELAGEGGAFRLTIARWLTPTKRWIHDVGIEPDVAVDIPAVGVPSQDPVLERALDVLGVGTLVPAAGRQ